MSIEKYTDVSTYVDALSSATQSSFNSVKPLTIVSGRKVNYTVRMGSLIIDDRHSFLEEVIGNNRALVVSTPTVNELYAKTIVRSLVSKGVSVASLVLECKEENKTLEQVQHICIEANELEFARNDMLVSIGGGVCSDLVTVAASLIRRGIRHVRVPTTLIGQVDAAIGIKGAINFRNSKSYLGCFYAPAEVILDPTFLRTLPRDDILCGLAEIIKIGLVIDRKLYELVENHGSHLVDSRFQGERAARDEILRRAISGMLDQLEPNLFEDQTYERLVDFGHTFSPLLESKSGFTMPHGMAVAIDMALSSAISFELDLLTEDELNRILNLLQTLGLPIKSDLLTLALCRQSLSAASKHRGGQPNLVIPATIGCGEVIGSEISLSDSNIKNALERIRKHSVSSLYCS